MGGPGSGPRPGQKNRAGTGGKGSKTRAFPRIKMHLPTAKQMVASGAMRVPITKKRNAKNKR